MPQHQILLLLLLLRVPGFTSSFGLDPLTAIVGRRIRPFSRALAASSHRDLLDENYSNEGCYSSSGRRRVLSTTFTTILVPSFTILGNRGVCWAAPDTSTGSSSPFMSQLQAESKELGTGLLESRVTENLLSPPSYGMEENDVYYPSWIKGTWQVSSKTLDVLAPCGVALFGGNTTYQKARSEIGTTLNYDSRFISDGSGNTIADREFNVISIAKAAMGQYSVLDMPVATPNKLTCMLAPKGFNGILRVDLLTLNRRQETISENRFDCSEVSREIVTPVNDKSNSNTAPASRMAQILKEVETTSLYTYNPSTNEIRCQQRSATFLLPSQSSPIAYKMWEAARGRPIDTRFYDVIYRKAAWCSTHPKHLACRSFHFFLVVLLFSLWTQQRRSEFYCELPACHSKAPIKNNTLILLRMKIDILLAKPNQIVMTKEVLHISHRSQKKS